MTRALCFDQAMANTGWAFGTENSSFRQDANDRYKFGLIKNPKRDELAERLAHLWRQVDNLFEEHDPDLVGYEEPFFPMQGQGGFKRKETFQPATGFLQAEIDDSADDTGGTRFNPEMLKQLQMVKGLVITQAGLRGIPVIGCTPSQWRKTVLGFGRKPKGEDEKFMKKRVQAHFRMLGADLPSSDDVSDGLGVLYHTLHGPEAAERKQGDLLSMVGGKL